MAYNVKRPIIISLDGNIGAGKSTLIMQISERLPQVQVITEPVQTWTDYKTSDGSNLLELFYSDKNRWAYTFQNCAVITRALTIQESIAKYPEMDVFITERSLLTDRNVFAEMLYNDGTMNEVEWKLYNKWYDTFSSFIQISGIVYLTTDTTNSELRIRKRNRAGEESITHEYLHKLDEQHEKWLSQTTVPVLRISTDDHVSIEDNVRMIGEFIQSIQTEKSMTHYRK